MNLITSGTARLKPGFRKTITRFNGMLLPAAGGLLLALIIMLAIGAPWFTNFDPIEQRPEIRLQPPSPVHWFGTDQFGRDIWSRVLYGGRLSLAASSLALLLVMGIGLAVGVAAGYLGGWVDAIMMRLVDILLAFPAMVLALVIVGLFEPGLNNVLLATVTTWWVGFARVTRSIVLQAREETTVEAARALGARPWAIIRREILPRVVGPVLVLATLDLGYLILAISGLSFLGLGAQPPSPEWGTMLADGRIHFLTAPHLMVFPGLMIFLTVLALNLLGEGLRDWLDPINTMVIGKEQ